MLKISPTIGGSINTFLAAERGVPCFGGDGGGEERILGDSSGDIEEREEKD